MAASSGSTSPTARLFDHQLARFLVIGLLTVAIDFVTYRIAWWLFGVFAVAKAIGFITGTVFAYFANRAWTFGGMEHATGSWWRFSLLYATTLAANVGINEAVLAAASDFGQRVGLAFLCATGTSSVLNFLGMKFLVFRAPQTRESEIGATV